MATNVYSLPDTSEKSGKLPRIPIFAGLSMAEWDALERAARLRNIEKGEFLFCEGEEAEGFFLLVKGRLKMFRETPRGKAVVLQFINDGEIIVAASFEVGEHPVTCEALQESQVAYFPVQEFDSLLTEWPRVAARIITAQSALLRRFLDRTEQLMAQTVTGRLCHYLLENRTEPDFVRLPVSKAEVAGLLGMVGETLSRSLRQLRDKKLIEVEGRNIRILDPEALTAEIWQPDR